MYRYFYVIILFIILLTIIYFNYCQIDFFTEKSFQKKIIHHNNSSNGESESEEENIPYYYEEIIGEEFQFNEGDDNDDNDNDDDNDDDRDISRNCCNYDFRHDIYPNRGNSTNLDDHSRVDYDNTKPDYNNIISYNQDKYYCNNFYKHKLLYPQAPDEMTIKTDNGTLAYRFKPNDICCIKGDPKNNFKKKHVKCCNFSNVLYDKPKTCYNTNLQ